MKKNNKNKTLKFFCLACSVGALCIVPIVVTSCGSNTNQSSSNDNKNNSQQTPFVPNINSNIRMMYELKQIINNDNINNLLNNYFNQNPNMLITNLNEYKNSANNLSINVQSNYVPKSSKWGTVEYDLWKKQSKRIVYSPNLPKIAISNMNDLYDELSKNYILTNILQAIGLTNQITNKTVSLVNTSNFAIIDKLIHVNVQVSQQSDTNVDTNVFNFYDLCIPLTAIDFDIANIELTISGLNVSTTKKTLNLKIINGISDTTTFSNTKGIVMPQNAYYVSPNGALEALGWLYPQQNQPDGTNISTNLNSTNIGDALGIYNVKFSNPVLNELAGDYPTYDFNYNGLYTITFDAKPIDGCYWQDNTNVVKKITTQTILFNLPNAYINVENSMQNPIQVTHQYFGIGSSYAYPNNFEEFKKAISNPNAIKILEYTLEQNQGSQVKFINLNFEKIWWDSTSNHYMFSTSVTLRKGFVWSDQTLEKYSQLYFVITDIFNQIQ